MDIVAVGAHPDDIEIGAGALIYKANKLGYRIHFLILTDEKAQPALRRAEARRAAQALGIPEERVMFAGLSDSYLRADGNTVRLVRDLMSARKLTPQVVVTHTQADSHNDHVEASRIAHAAFRACVFLHYSTHVSAEVDRFAPRIFVDVSGARLEAKDMALSSYHSQKTTISRYDLSKYECRLGTLARIDRAEGFEVSCQSNAPNVFGAIVGLSDSPFHRLWIPLLGDERITLIYETYRSPTNMDFYSGLHENLGRDRIRQAFLDQWVPSTPLIEKYSLSPDARRTIKSGNTILSGSPVSNPIVRLFYSKLPRAGWVVKSEQAFSLPYLCDQESGQRFYAKFNPDNSLRQDVGLLSRFINPFDASSYVICALGATSFASRMALEFLSDPGEQPTLAEIFSDRSDFEIGFIVGGHSASIQVIGVHQ